MEKLSMCRVCLRQDARLHSIVGTHLQEMYESLVLMPLETTDGRPALVCYICCARLKNCYELRKSCLQSEELFTQMLSDNKLTLQGITSKTTFTMHNVIHWSIRHEPEKSLDSVAVEAVKCGVKDEQNDPEDSDEDALEENNVADNIQSLIMVKVEQLNSDEDAVEENNVADNIQFSDSDVDPLIIVKEEQSSDLTLNQSNEASPRNSEDFTSSNLKDHERVKKIFQEFIKTVVADKTSAESTNKETFNLAHGNTKRSTSVPRSDRVQHMCDTCQQCYSSKCELERHIRVCSDVWKTDLSRENSTHQCNISKRKFSAKSRLSNVHTLVLSSHTGKKRFQCGICKKQFQKKSHVMIHIRTHTGEKPYHCGICKKQFSVQSNFKQHMRTHTGEKPFLCDTCHKQFSEKKGLNRHMRTHTGEKPYHCGICKKQFSLQYSLRTHMRTHTGEKPFHCETCNKQFSQKKGLNKHMRTHTGEKPYHCDICKKQFSQRFNLDVHIRSHTGERPYHCNICKKQFSQRFSLDVHIRSHTGERPYHCDICKKQFSAKTSLISHLRGHTGEKPFSCGICKKQFSQKGNLRIHMRTHT